MKAIRREKKKRIVKFKKDVFNKEEDLSKYIKKKNGRKGNI